MTGTAPIDAASLAAALIRCASVTPADAGAIGTLAAALEPHGFACHELVMATPGTDDIANLYARWGAGGRHFSFAGHTDVVPAGDRAAWSADPFGGIIRDGLLIGRGAADMKGAIAAFAAAATRFLAMRGDGFDGSISLLITGDEEGVSINGTAKLMEWLAARGETIDACLVGEPTNEQILGDMVKIGRRGSLNATLTVHGTAGHVGYPHLADNPVHRLVAMLADLIAIPLDDGTPHFQPSTLQVSTVDVGNPATNVIPATARAVFNIRFNDLWTGAALETWLRRQIEPHGGNWDLAIKISGEAFMTPPSKLAVLIADAAEAVTGRRPELSTTGGTSDARFIRRFCPVAEFGLVGRTMHKADEAVPIEDLARLTDIYQGVLDRFFAPRA
jgi:succinyl-diaminopimelate desuccinylase